MDHVPASVLSLVDERARAVPDDVAILAPGRANATYAAVAEDVRRVGGRLRANGIAQVDRVALVVENGPEAGLAFLAISSAAVCAPLNPSYRAAELEFYLRDLRARAVVVGAELETPAREVAGALGIDVLELRVDMTRPAGRFELHGPRDGFGDITEPTPDAEALILHTSGTTARPKIVPLTHRQLVASARNVSLHLGLGPRDRCLNIMPLFHIHGLVAGLLASLHAGSSVICAPGFHQVRFFEWLRELDPTWTTAVPTMYQSILERARRDPTLAAEHRLRFLRSSSAALPPSIMEALEQVLTVPVVESYGMTEAAHQMASNPLPPGVRKPGSVGLPAGPEVAILDDEGGVLPAGMIGEVAVRGENVFAGYESSPEANVQAFDGGWFRTGDQGRLDDDGYLHLTGRLKEIINRAGEKVSPAELDGVLLRHPAVAQAVTFGVPHARLGEEIAAAVVVRDEHSTDALELQDFVAQTVAPFKVPRRIVFVDDIPKGATGKVQRLSLADQLAITLDGPHFGANESASPFLEGQLQRIWSDVLALDEVGPLDDFFALGGDSILGAEAIARTRDLLGTPDLPLVAIVRAPTPRALAAEIEDEYGWNRSGVIRITPGDETVRPLFIVHGVDGDIVRFAAIARLLGPNRGVYALRAPGHGPGETTPTNVESLARRYLDEIRGVQDSGPYLIAGSCMGATVALELSHRLAAAAAQSALLLVDPRIRRPISRRYSLYRVRRRLRPGRMLRAIARRLSRRLRPLNPGHDSGAVWCALETARESYVCRPTAAPVAVLRSTKYENKFDLPSWYLQSVFPHVVYDEEVQGEHDQLFQQPALAGLHAAMRRALARLEAEIAS